MEIICYVAIHHVDYDMNYLLIDDFAFYDYTIPTGAWQEMAVTGTSATLSGLATNNAYEYQIQSVKESAASEWSAAQDFALLTLANDADNTSLIDAFNGKKAHVTLADRILYKDNHWNTLYLPFDLTKDEMAASPLADADYRSLIGSTVDGTTLTLTFSSNLINWFGPDGGYPYIIKWTDGSNIVNPEFANVTITSKTESTAIKDWYSGITVTFKGTYASIAFTDEDRSILFVGADNKLFRPLAGAKIGAQRAYFQIDGANAAVKQFVMDFGEDGPTDIRSIDNEQLTIDNDGEWYDLSGRKLTERPSRKGIYVNGGRKVTIK